MSRFIRCIRKTVAIFALAAAPAAAAERYTQLLADYRPPEVTLVDAQGAVVPLRAELERPGPVLLQLVFTTCTTVCPVMMATFAAAQDRLPADARLLSISIDPEEDTPARLREHAALLRAGSRWRFLTGRLADVVAVQKAFDAYTSDKMRHQPLTFLHGGQGAPWLRLEGFPTPAELVAELATLQRQAEPGRGLYRDGTLPSGAPLRGVTEGGVAIEGRAAACAGCHRRSGYGGVEGREIVPPITAPALFAEQVPQRAELFRKLFQEDLSPSAQARIHDLGTRPAYTAETLAAALRDGRDPSGRTLDPLMPRYRLDEGETADLIAYLRTLAAAPSPGVDGEEIHFATIIAPGVDPGKRQAVIGVLEAFFHRKNADFERLKQRPEFSPRYKDELLSSFRKWVLHVWDLDGAPETWADQLAAKYREQPVFAVLSGLGAGDWTPVHDFCEREEIPCLFPETELPPAAPGAYSIYFSAGLTLEAEALGRHLRESAPAGPPLRVVQVFRDDPRGTVPAAALRHALDGAVNVHLEDMKLAGDLTPAAWESLLDKSPSVVVLWLPGSDVILREPRRPKDLGAGPAFPQQLYLSWSLLGETLPPLREPWRRRVLLLDRFAPPGFESPHVYRARAWLRARGLAETAERLQLDTWFTLSLTESALMHLVDNYSRDYFIEIVERETERVPSPGVYSRLSLGPGQRFASKGCSLLRVTADGKLEAVGERIVP